MAHLHFCRYTKPNKKCKRATSQRTKTNQMNGQTTYKQEGRTDNKRFERKQGEMSPIELLYYI